MEFESLSQDSYGDSVHGVAMMMSGVQVQYSRYMNYSQGETSSIIYDMWRCAGLW